MDRRMTAQNFINQLSNKIDKIKDFPVLKSLAIAQACLESQYGQKHFYNNLFGIKCHNLKKYAGCRLGNTKEFIKGSYGDYRLAFQVYNSFDESLEDYARLMNASRYKPVREAKDYVEATENVKACGYATGISYVGSLRKIIEKYKLYEFDSKYNIMNKDLVLTRSFKYGEFWSNNFGKEKVPPSDEYYADIFYIANQLQKVRDKLNQDFKPRNEIKIIITSGYRTKEWNSSKNVEGAADSLHLCGRAADSRAIGVPLMVYYSYILRYTDFNHLGFYKILNFVHAGLINKITIFKY